MNRIPARLVGIPVLSFICIGPWRHAQVQVLERARKYDSGEAKVTVECFAPAAQGKFPAIVLLHGSGGLELGNGRLFRGIARGLAQKGFVVLVPHFFETNGHVVGAPFQTSDIRAYLESVRDAIDFAATSDNVDSERIGVMGVSLGSYLAFIKRRMTRGSRPSSPSRDRCLSSRPPGSRPS